MLNRHIFKKTLDPIFYQYKYLIIMPSAIYDKALYKYSKPSCRWYFGKIKRIEAEKKLLLVQNEHGAYLIRDSESRRNDFSLSVRDGDTVKHYRIRQLDEGGFFIARRTTFRLDH